MADIVSKSLYGFNFNIKFTDGKKETINILSDRIKSIIINRDYINRNMPTIYMSLMVESQLYSTIVNNKNNGFIILKIDKYESEKSSNTTNYINLKFNYICDTDKQKILDEDSTNADDYHVLNLGLYLQSIIDNNKKKIINGVFKNTNTISIINYYMSHMDNIIIEKFDNNRNIPLIIIPPIDSITNLLDFLNQLSGFYDTPYLFFIDFDRIYLMSTKGTLIDAKDGTFNNININVVDDELPSQNQGLTINKTKKVYTFNVSKKSIDIQEDNYNSNSVNILSGVTADGYKVSAKSTVKNTNSTGKESYMRIYNDNLSYMKQLQYEKDSRNIVVTVTKIGIDPSIFTPNKSYHITSNIDKINGNYILVNKKELFASANGSSITSITTLVLQKIS